jgi:vancomycin permeability regulator SanA
MIQKRQAAKEPEKNSKQKDGTAAAHGKHASKIALRIVFAVIVLCVLVIGLTNIFVISSVKDRILSVEEVVALGQGAGNPQCIEVLGASVIGDQPSQMLADRLDTSLALYQIGVSDILLFSGDNGTNEYNEVEAMRRYAVAHGDAFGAKSDCIYLDYAGFSTYESMYRLKAVFGVDKAVIVTQKYHLYRALYTAEKLGVDAYGVAAPPTSSGQFIRDIREVLARTKDFFFVLFDVQPTFLGAPVELILPASQQ